MVVDVFGQPPDWDAIAPAVDGLAVIDDCCEAIGATYRGLRWAVRAAGCSPSIATSR